MTTRKSSAAVATPLPFEPAQLTPGVFVPQKGFKVKMGRTHMPLPAVDYGPNELPCLHGQCWKQARAGRGIDAHCPGCYEARCNGERCTR